MEWGEAMITSLSNKLTDKEFHHIRQLVYNSIGVNLTEAKKTLVISRLSRRLRELNLESFSSYIVILEKNQQELEKMLNLITTNVTKFFREEHHFNYITKYFLPILEQQAAQGLIDKSIRVWSAGCATGEEPYTIAMVLHNYFSHKENWDIKIMASDVNTETLKKAYTGIYTKEEVAGIPYQFLTKYFKLGTGVNMGKFKVKNVLRQLITFKRINLIAAKEYPIGKQLDMIFCRNVFIYFDKPTQGEILNRYYKHLNNNGLLLLGHSESMNSTVDAGTRWLLLKHTIYKKA